MARPNDYRIAAALCLMIAACTVADDTNEAQLDVTGHPATEDLDSPQSAEQLALQHFAEYHDSDAPEVNVRHTVVDPQGRAHVRLEQRYSSIPVFGGEAIVHLLKDGSLARITDGLVRGIDVDINPAISADQAVDIAVDFAGGPDLATGRPVSELLIVRHEGKDHLSYRVQIRQFEDGEKPAMPVVFIDAHHGSPIFAYDDLEHVILADADAATFDMQGGVNYAMAAASDSSDAVANDAHIHAKQTLDFFFTSLGRDSFDDGGTRVDSYVHFRTNYINAFWDGQRLTYGDGDSVTADPLVSLDIVSHEFSHGVTAHTAGLIYQGESGALNEATSDIFAAATEAFVEGVISADTWMVGEDVWTPAVEGDALRYMANPTLDGSSREHYSTRYIGAADNGGVHWNSGIANLFFYLLSEGGDHPNPVYRVGTVAGVGVKDATNIWYAALNNEIVPNTGFVEARSATLAACFDLFGGGAAQCNAVADAWCEVGVGGDDCLPGNSCDGYCDALAPSGCYCDPFCIQFGDCCADYVWQCLPAEPSCEGSCGEQSPGECWCDEGCMLYGDCCPDYEEACS